jgi:hypothetical protein
MTSAAQSRDNARPQNKPERSDAAIDDERNIKRFQTRLPDREDALTSF